MGLSVGGHPEVDHPMRQFAQACVGTCDGAAVMSTVPTATLYFSQPISSTPMQRQFSCTGICVVGTGKPALISSNRSHVSLGEAAPASTRERTDLNRRRPRAPGWRLTRSCTSSIEKDVARCSASSRATASPVGRCRARSNAVRAGVVTGRPATRASSSPSSRGPRVTTPAGGCGLRQTISTGSSSSIQLEPCSAAAASPASAPRRPDHSHAATERVRSEGAAHLGTYVSG